MIRPYTTYIRLIYSFQNFFMWPNIEILHMRLCISARVDTWYDDVKTDTYTPHDKMTWKFLPLLMCFVWFFKSLKKAALAFDEILYFSEIYSLSTLHSALKLEKKCNFKSAKKHYLLFQKRQKINFCTRKKSENCIFGSFQLFSGAKIDFFLPFLKL